MNQSSSTEIEGIQTKGQESGDQTTDNSTIHPNENGQSNVPVESKDNDPSSDWTKDKRYESHWEKNPNKVYDTVKFLESRQSEFDNQKNDFSKLQDRYKDIEGKYQESQNYINEVKELLNHPTLGNKIQSLVDDHRNNELRSQYGENLNENQLEIFSQLDEKIDKISQWQKDYENNQDANKTTEMALNNWDEIKSLANKYDISWSENDEKIFLEHCINNKIPISNMKSEFIQHSLPEIERFSMLKGESSARETIKKGSQSSLGHTTNNSSNNGHQQLYSSDSRTLTEKVLPFLNG